MVRDYSIDSVKGVCLLHMFVLHIFIIYGFFDAKGCLSLFCFVTYILLLIVKYSHVFLIVRMLAWVLSIFMGDICFVKLQ